MMCVGVLVLGDISVDVASGTFVFVGRKVGVLVTVDVIPGMTGVGLKMTGVRVGSMKGVGLFGSG